MRLYDVLNANQDWLPAGLGARTPIVKPKGLDDVPVLAVTLWSPDGRSAADLERVAHTLEAELKRVPGSREVATLGGPGRVVSVALNPARLRDRGVDVLRLKATLAAANLGLPAGAVLDTQASASGNPQLLAVQTGEVLRSAEEVADLVVGVNNGRPVYLREVAEVSDGPAQAQRHVWYTPGAGAATAALPTPGAVNPQTAAPDAAGAAGQVYPAVTLTLTKQPGRNAVDVAQAARARLDELRNTVIPEGVQATITRDYGQTAAVKANKLIQKPAFATASVIGLMGLALGRREAVTVGAAVILTLTAALFASWAWGFTLTVIAA